MKLHSTMTNQEWDSLLNYLTARGALITFFAEKNDKNEFVRYKYALVEYKDEFYYMQNPLNMFTHKIKMTLRKLTRIQKIQIIRVIL